MPTELGELTPFCEHEHAKVTKPLCLLPWTWVITCSRVLGSQQKLSSVTLILQPIPSAEGALPTLPGELRLPLWGLANLSSSSGGLTMRGRRDSWVMNSSWLTPSSPECLGLGQGWYPKHLTWGVGRCCFSSPSFRPTPPEVPVHSPGTQHPKGWSLT